jgi:type VI protein secretion system component Hcp
MDDTKKPEEQVSAAQPELNEGELDKVAGGSPSSSGSAAGKVQHEPITITKFVDLASPKLYE